MRGKRFFLALCLGVWALESWVWRHDSGVGAHDWGVWSLGEAFRAHDSAFFAHGTTFLYQYSPVWRRGFPEMDGIAVPWWRP